jgi:hypothetical protein
VTQPVLDATTIAKALGIAPANVYAPLEALVDAGVLAPTSDRRRGRIWRSDEVLGALDDFAVRAGKRRVPEAGASCDAVAT